MLALAAIVPTFVLVVPASPAQARACQIDYYCTTTFYSDSSRTTVVGRLTEDCDGARYFWGSRGHNARFVESPC
jgi:hypothetical protein